MNDIIVKIEETNGWNGVNAWLNVSKTTRKLFLKKEILKQSIDCHLKQNYKKFPDWAFRSIRADEYLHDILPQQILDLPIKMVEKLKNDIEHIKKKSNYFFITGGFASSLIFDVEYSDIDIWYSNCCEHTNTTNNTNDTNTTNNTNNTNTSSILTPQRPSQTTQTTQTTPQKKKKIEFDFVPITASNANSLQKTISFFDISATQIGVLFKNGKVMSTHFTPLFLYNFWFKNMIIRLVPLSMDYSRGFGNIHSVCIEDLYDHHTDIEHSKYLKGTQWYNETDYHKYCLQKNLTSVNDPVKRRFPFSDCLQCKAYLNARRQDPPRHGKNSNEHHVIMRWFDRVEKYRQRHANSSQIYVRGNFEVVDYHDDEDIDNDY